MREKAWVLELMWWEREVRMVESETGLPCWATAKWGLTGGDQA
jgi:hypothetical protein